MNSKVSADRRARVLVVEDDREMRRLLSDLLTDEGYEVDTVSDGHSALERYKQAGFHVVITDLMMPGMKGSELVRRLREIDPEALVLVITAFGSIESAVETMQAGAYNYLTKPFLTDEILLNLSRALEQRNLKKELQSLREEVHGRYGLKNILGNSDKMQRVFEIVSRVSDVEANVLITGESGTGKELIARAIHYHSSRSRAPFIPVNSAAIPETLLESELFGSLRGAFTDAKKDRRGLFREADGGTLFLDEISELPLNLQAKLLRVIEDKEVRPLGASRSEKVDVRILAASNRDIEELAGEGKFRRDLFYRLNVIRVDLPPLRERLEDIPLLADHFLQKFSGKARRKIAGITEDALAALVSYPWPGNVRELEHTIERAVLLGKGEQINVTDLPPQLLARSNRAVSLGEAIARGYTLKDLEREYIKKVLEATGENKTEAATILGVDRTTLYRKLEELKTKE
ncbi:MAG: sigma-54-dependent Fis family transcriptional regulator [Deltaproteobacteria bacterium]|nr:sigma-54-dependent Fis family transcriptional regulator [Deltaproteobacteria bacterium]